MGGFLAIAMLVLTLAACGVTDPYVYKVNEFNRDSESFNVEPEDLSEVEICHLGAVTSTATVSAMAEERCAEFGKSARFVGNRYGKCPLATPTLSRFDCVSE